MEPFLALTRALQLIQRNLASLLARATLVTSGFVYADFVHLVFNTFTILAFGFGLERQIGTPRLVVLYMFGLLASGIATWVNIILGMHTLTLLRTDVAVPALGLGTWRMGESARSRAAEIEAVRLALDIGYRLIDTAEMYGEGGAEEVVGAALRAWTARPGCTRDDVFIVSKVYPHNASRKGAVAACERSLKRLGLDHIDLYLLHWRGQHPLRDTFAAFEELQRDGRIRAWGVSNFDTDDMRELWQLPQGAYCATNQVYYSASERGIEFDLLPALRERGVPAMAYCPIDQGALARDATFAQVGARHHATAAQAALAWVLAQPGVIAIPKAVRAAHLRENFAAASIKLSADDRALIESAFPPPRRKQRLAIV
jgi:diketogulonate reductase-like aldo/keto reductase